MINSLTKLNLLLSPNIAKSCTTEVHNQISRQLGLSDQFVVIASEVVHDDLTIALQAAKTLGFNGLCVGSPYKHEVMQYLDDIDQTALLIGAVNTIVNKNGLLKGFNTEWLGALMPLAQMKQVEIKKITHIPKFLTDQKVGIIGAGGAARAVAYAALIAGADLLIFNRTISKAEALSEEFKRIFPKANIHYFDNKHAQKLLFCDAIINTTPVSIYANGNSPISKEFLRPDQTVFEAMFPAPFHTKIIKEAQDLGCQTIFGDEMFLFRTIYQYELLNGIKPEENVVRAIIKKINID